MRTAFFKMVLVLGALLGSVCAWAAPQSELWERWTAHDPASTRTVDHTEWRIFLEQQLEPGGDGVNRIAYGEMPDEDRGRVDDYVRMLSEVPISQYSRDEQLAYWINFYNALTVKVVLDHFPVESILKISITPGLFKVGPWGKQLVEVEGEPLSLDDMEHRILRPIWKDPRVHYAVNCASEGCPNLRVAPFTPANMETSLDEAAREYINSERGVILKDGNLYVSSIYQWFSEDFGGTDQAVIEHLRVYAAPDLSTALAERRRIDDDFYDWDLNNLQ